MVDEMIVHCNIKLFVMGLYRKKSVCERVGYDNVE